MLELSKKLIFQKQSLLMLSMYFLKKYAVSELQSHEIWNFKLKTSGLP